MELANARQNKGEMITSVLVGSAAQEGPRGIVVRPTAGFATGKCWKLDRNREAFLQIFLPKHLKIEVSLLCTAGKSRKAFHL